MQSRQCPIEHAVTLNSNRTLIKHVEDVSFSHLKKGLILETSSFLRRSKTWASWRETIKSLKKEKLGRLLSNSCLIRKKSL